MLSIDRLLNQFNSDNFTDNKRYYVLNNKRYLNAVLTQG